MIELLAQLAQTPPVVNYRSNMDRSCPGFTADNNRQIGQAVLNHLLSINPNIKQGDVRVFFTWEMINASQSAPIDRFIDFVQTQTSDYKFVFFCPHVMNVFSFDVILPEAAYYISRVFGIPYTNYSDLINQLGLTEIGKHNGGTLYYVRPRR
jgi:hypothetical protein